MDAPQKCLFWSAALVTSYKYISRSADRILPWICYARGKPSLVVFEFQCNRQRQIIRSSSDEVERYCSLSVKNVQASVVLLSQFISNQWSSYARGKVLLVVFEFYCNRHRQIIGFSSNEMERHCSFSVRNVKASVVLFGQLINQLGLGDVQIQYLAILINNNMQLIASVYASNEQGKWYSNWRACLHSPNTVYSRFVSLVQHITNWNCSTVYVFGK